MKLTTGESAFWRVTLEGDTWDFDPEDLTVDEMVSIEAEAGMSVDEWLAELQRGMGRAFKILVWWLRGRKTPADAVNFRIGDLNLEPVIRPVKRPPKTDGRKHETGPSLSSLPSTRASTSKRSAG